MPPDREDRADGDRFGETDVQMSHARLALDAKADSRRFDAPLLGPYDVARAILGTLGRDGRLAAGQPLGERRAIELRLFQRRRIQSRRGLDGVATQPDGKKQNAQSAWPDRPSAQ